MLYKKYQIKPLNGCPNFTKWVKANDYNMDDSFDSDLEAANFLSDKLEEYDDYQREAPYELRIKEGGLDVDELRFEIVSFYSYIRC